ncbi:hypothetical protein OHB19_43830 [Streptomyces sp. NBC_00893]|nr:hypothetical protein [Streptomyces sp. NBC_00893]MCX4852034.1 hypothetical protein [Streptomyces sp. NBC_00893]
MLERGEAGDVLVQDVVLALVGGQGAQLLDGGVEPATGAPPTELPFPLPPSAA